MTIFEKLRLSHAALAGLATAAYLTGEAGIIHAWLGYAVAVVLLARVVWGIFGPRQVGISRFLPDLAGLTQVRVLDHPAVSRLLIAGIVASLLLVTTTGVVMDRFRALPSFAEATTVSRAHALITPAGTASSNRQVVAASERRELRDEHEGRGDNWIKEVHEAAANLMLLFVGLHVGYLLLFKRKLAAFMLFQRSPAAQKP